MPLYAAFVNINLLGKVERCGLFGLKKRDVDPTEGRWEKIAPILHTYGLKCKSSGFDDQFITVPARDREESVNTLNELFKDIKEACGAEFPVELNIGDICISIVKSKP